MKIRHLIVLIMVIFSSTGAIFASNNTEVPKRTKLVVLGYGDPETGSGKQFVVNIEQYIAANPEVDIIWDLKDNDHYNSRLQAALSGGEQLDLVYMWNGGLRHQPILDADEAIDQLQFVNTTLFTDGALIGGGKDGELFAIPNGKSVDTVFYSNDALLKTLGLEPATTYEELVAQVEIAQNAGKKILAYPGAVSWCHDTFIYSMLVGRFGGAQHVRNLILKNAKFTDEPSLKAFTFIKSMYDDGIFTDDTFKTDYNDSLAEFNRGQALYMIDGSWRSSQITLPRTSWNQFFVVPEELYPSSSNGTYSAGWALLKSATIEAKHSEDAQDLLQYLTGVEASKIRASYTGVVPVVKIEGDTQFKPGTEKAGEFILGIKTITDSVGNYIDGITKAYYCDSFEELCLGLKSPQELADETQAIYEKN